VNSIQPISGEVTLTPYYFDTANQTMLGGILATIQSSTAVPRCSEGETGEILRASPLALPTQPIKGGRRN